jgi:hypothetical protein
MRRLVASFVLSMVAWGSLAPLALAATGNATPACCRRNGKHHCMGTSGMAASGDGDASFRANPPDCPFRSQIAAPTNLAQPQHPIASTLPLPSAPFVSIADFPLLSACSSASDRQRGPPPASSL